MLPHKDVTHQQVRGIIRRRGACWSIGIDWGWGLKKRGVVLLAFSLSSSMAGEDVLFHVINFLRTQAMGQS